MPVKIQNVTNMPQVIYAVDGDSIILQPREVAFVEDKFAKQVNERAFRKLDSSTATFRK